MSSSRTFLGIRPLKLRTSVSFKVCIFCWIYLSLYCLLVHCPYLSTEFDTGKRVSVEIEGLPAVSYVRRGFCFCIPYDVDISVEKFPLVSFLLSCARRKGHLTPLERAKAGRRALAVRPEDVGALMKVRVQPSKMWKPRF